MIEQKLKPIRQIKRDASISDLVRIVFKENKIEQRERIGYIRDITDFYMKRGLGFYSVSLRSELIIVDSKVKNVCGEEYSVSYWPGKNPGILGYEILRRRKWMR